MRAPRQAQQRPSPLFPPPKLTSLSDFASLTLEDLQFLKSEVTEMTAKVSAAHGCNTTITWSPDAYPPTVNSPELWEDVGSKVAASVSVTGEVSPVKPTMGAEDFSFLSLSVPSNFYLLGQGSTPGVTDWGLHHPRFDIDEEVLVKGVELHVRSAVEGLEMLKENQGGEL